MIRALLVALLFALPAFAAEDFTQRSTCLGHWGVFTDGEVASAEVDNCDAGGQDGENDVDWAISVIVDDSDAPPLAPSGSDSTHHRLEFPFVYGEILGTQAWAFPDFTYVGWSKRVDTELVQILMHYESVADVEGAYSIRCMTAGKLRGRVSSTFSSITTEGGPCPLDTWMLLGIRYDGSVNDEIAVFTSESTKSNTLKDCGVDPCATEASGPINHNTTVRLLMNQLGAKLYKGNLQEHAFFDEALTDEEICQFCRCGGTSDVRGVGRVDECNRCIVPDYEGCRRVID